MSQLLIPPAGDPRTPEEYTYDMQRSGAMYMAQPAQRGDLAAESLHFSLAGAGSGRSAADDERIILEWVKRLVAAASDDEIIAILKDIDACECDQAHSCQPERGNIGRAIHKALAVAR